MIKCMAIVGSEIFWKGMGCGLSGEQRVSPIWMSAMPEIATMAPIFASFTSTLFKPSYSYSLLIFTFFSLSGSWWFTMTTS